MKKSLFVLGVAVAALASCTQSEVLEVAEGRAIGFDAFVNNQTKAVTPVTAITSSEFYVFGEYGTVAETSWTKGGNAFNNETGDATYYWEPNQTYRFGAYADGLAGKVGNASFDAATKTLSFPAYTPEDLDLVAAVSADIASGEATASNNSNSVALIFKHMLSQVKLTFTTDAASTYQLTISDVSISNAVSTADGTLEGNDGTPTWGGTTTSNGYAYEEFNGGQLVSKNTPVNQVKLVIPQSNTDGITVTFTATVNAEGEGTTTFTANLGHSLTDANNTWKPGYCYNYTANVELKDVLDNLGENDVPILFNPSVEGWQTEQNVPVTPTPQD